MSLNWLNLKILNFKLQLQIFQKKIKDTRSERRTYGI